jgi:regulator of cell morphogenesis and NO signaling
VLAELSLTDLSDYIVGTHHSYVNNELPQLLGYAEKVATKHGGRYAELIKVAQALSALKEEMFLHMHKEEVVLFPRIKELESLAEQDHGRVNLSVTYLQAPVRMMEQEHDHAGELMADIRELTHDYTPPMDACTTFRLLYSSLQAFEADLHQHVHIENNILFPRAIRLAKQLSR